jgi:hypothetical protein
MARFVYRYSGLLFLAYVAGGMLFLVLIDSVFNGGFSFSMKILWLPVALAIFGFTCLNREFLRAEMGSSAKPWLLAAMLYPIVLLMSWPYVMALNAATARGDTLVYNGRIERKWIHHGSGRFGDTCEIDIRDTQSSEVVTIRVSPEKYASLSQDDIVTVAFTRGGFGIPYRWRFTEPNQALERTAAPARVHISHD